MKKPHVPSLDGIPGIMPGTNFILPEPAEVGPAQPDVPDDGQITKATGSKAVKNLNRRMMPSNKK